MNKDLFTAVRLEKEDGIDPALQLLMEWRPDTRFAIMGGINIANGSMILGWQHLGKQKRQGINISNHPLLGYGIEILWCHGWK